MAKQAKPALYFGGHVPFEHVVVSHDELHPKLQREVDRILHHTKASRLGVAGQASAYATLQAPGSEKWITFGLQSVLGYMIGAESYKAESAHPKPEGKEVIRMIGNTIIPYSVPAALTKRLGGVITGIANDEESPFNRDDSAELLREYQYGVIDNAGNIILLKHPLDTRAEPLAGFKLIKKMAAWHQPFHRTRFELNKPEKRVKQKSPVQAGFRLKPALANCCLAMPFTLPLHEEPHLRRT